MGYKCHRGWRNGLFRYNGKIFGARKFPFVIQPLVSTVRKRPLCGQDAYPCHKASLGVEQPVPRISVSFSPLPQVFRHPARGWPSQGDTISRISAYDAARGGAGRPSCRRAPAGVGEAPTLCHLPYIRIDSSSPPFNTLEAHTHAARRMLSTILYREFAPVPTEFSPARVH
jgi:hypothetical protein